MIHRVVRLTYDGSAFSGWQRQRNAMTVQQTLEDTWAGLFSENMHTTGASRTDAGVHARGQVAMFRTKRRLTDDQVMMALNSRLPQAMAVNAARVVDADFHARYGARGKHYTYRLETGRVRPVLARQIKAYVPSKPDAQLMGRALRRLEGERDFTAFMDQGSPTRRPVRRLIEGRVERKGDTFIFHIKGDGFLYHMVRIIVGTIWMVGTGKLCENEMMALTEKGQRVGLGPTMSASGLCLERVFYRDALFGSDGLDDLYGRTHAVGRE